MLKIFVLPVRSKFQPGTMGKVDPPHNDFRDIEGDFLVYLRRHPELLTNNPSEADWHYLPIFWTNWLVSHNYGKKNLYKLQDEVLREMIDDSKTFTVCRYDDGPLVAVGRTTVFLGCRKSEYGIDVPNIVAPHLKPCASLEKKYLASFIGSLSTHPIRKEMAKVAKERNDVLVIDGRKNTEEYVRLMLESYVALAPRGYGGGSFRFFEAMQLGVVPMLIGDIDVRPFKRYIDWDKISFYVDDVNKLNEVLGSISKAKALEMGVRAAGVWAFYLNYQRWCPYLLKELERCSVE